MNETDRPYVNSAEEMAGRFHAELIAQMPGWKHRLVDNPESLERLERDVHQNFAQGADLVTAGLVSMVMCSEDQHHLALQLRWRWLR